MGGHWAAGVPWVAEPEESRSVHSPSLHPPAFTFTSFTLASPTLSPLTLSHCVCTIATAESTAQSSFLFVKT